MKVKRYKAFRTILCKMSFKNTMHNLQPEFEALVFDGDLMISSYGHVFGRIGVEVYEYDDVTKMLEVWDVIDRRVLVEKIGLYI